MNGTSAINKPGAQALMANVYSQCVEASRYSFAHQAAKRRKETLFTWFARITLVAAIITVGLSGFGFSQVGQGADPQTAGSWTRESIVWFLTALAAVMTTAAKLAEQHVGRPDDIKSHLNAHLNLEGGIRSLSTLAGQIVSYLDRATPDLEALEALYTKIERELRAAALSVAVSNEEKFSSQAADAVKASAVWRFHTVVMEGTPETSEEIPADSPGVVAAQRGGRSR